MTSYLCFFLSLLLSCLQTPDLSTHSFNVMNNFIAATIAQGLEKREALRAEVNVMERKGYTRQEIDEYRKKWRYDKRKKVEATYELMIEGDQAKFVADLKERYKNFAPNRFLHYFIYVQYKKEFFMALKKLKYTCLPYVCDCTTEGEREHLHVIVDTKNENPHLKRLGQQLSRTVRDFMDVAGLQRDARDKRTVYGKKITSGQHLLNTILYIQTGKTRGRHGAKVTTCRHHNHREKDIIMLGEQGRNHFKKTVLFKEIPEFKKEHEKLWEAEKERRRLKKLKTFKDLGLIFQDDDNNGDDIEMYNDCVE